MRTRIDLYLRYLVLYFWKGGGGKLSKNVIENLRDQLYRLVELHRYNLLHSDVIRKSQELDILISETTHVKLKGCLDSTKLSNSTE